MGNNNTKSKSAASNKTKKRIPKKELTQLQELKIENKELKQQVRALHKFIKRIKTIAIDKIPDTPKSATKKPEPVNKCPQCNGDLNSLILTRLDGNFERSTCTSCSYTTPLSKVDNS